MHGLPPNPANDPLLQSNPSAWFDFLGFYMEAAMLAFAAIFLVTAIDLTFLKHRRLALLAGLIAVPMTVVGVAVPGLLILADQSWLHSVLERWILISALQFLWGCSTLLVAGLPIIASFQRHQSKKRKWIVAGLSFGSPLITLLWSFAIHFAFSTEKNPAETQHDTPPPSTETSPTTEESQ